MNRIKRYFEKRKRKKELHSISQRKICRLLNQFFINKKIVRRSLEITDVRVKNKLCYVVVTVTLGRPGLLIGKMGETIDDLTLYLEKILEKKVLIKIKESKLWW